MSSKSIDLRTISDTTKIPAGTTVKARRPHKGSGKTTGSFRPCALEGCGGFCVTTKWTDGATTHPCIRGMIVHKHHLQIH